jgi:hypothetical protein
MQVLILFVALVLVFISSIEGRLRKYEDTLCILTGSPARDAREAHVFETTREQRCQLFAGPNTIKPGHMHYSVVGTPSDSPKKFTWRITRANIEIDKSHLDMGSEPNDFSHSYIHLLDDTPKTEAAPTGTAVTGLILGKKLGGSGRDQQNLFPASSITQPEYKSIEDKIYNCIKAGAAHKAAIEWNFKYQTNLRTRPYAVWYKVRFTGENGQASTCADIEQHMNN